MRPQVADRRLDILQKGREGMALNRVAVLNRGNDKALMHILHQLGDFFPQGRSLPGAALHKDQQGPGR